MFVILDCDDVQDLKVVKADALMDTEIATIYFDTYEEAEEYADRHCGECQIVEVDG